MNFRAKPPLLAMHNVVSDSDIEHMIAMYRASGGILRADDLALLFEKKGCGDFVRVARMIATREIFSFQLDGHFWIPMFQFHAHNMTIKRDVRKIINALGSVLDSWTLAQWFTQPNLWLQDKRPIEMLDSELSVVLVAAQADRVVAKG